MDAFLSAMQIDPSSRISKDMHEFFAVCPDVLTPAAWFLDKVESRFFHVCGVLPAGWDSGTLFMTQVNPPSDEDVRLHPVPCIFWYFLRHCSLLFLIALARFLLL